MGTRGRRAKTCYGVEVIYPNDPNYAVIARKDEDLLRAVQREVPQVAHLPEGGFGPAGRDLQFDHISYGKGFTRAQAEHIAKAAKTRGMKTYTKRTPCRVR